LDKRKFFDSPKLKRQQPQIHAIQRICQHNPFARAAHSAHKIKITIQNLYWWLMW